MVLFSNVSFKETYCFVTHSFCVVPLGSYAEYFTVGTWAYTVNVCTDNGFSLIIPPAQIIQQFY